MRNAMLGLMALGLSSAGCSIADGSAHKQVRYPAAAHPAAPMNATQNSVGPNWVWPFPASQMAHALTHPISMRPIDLSRLRPAVGTHPCAPVQVGAYSWIAPDCSNAMMQPLSASPNVAERRFAYVSSFDSTLPSEVDLRAQGLDGPVKDQQMVGVCWSFAVSTVMDNALRRAGRREVIAPLHVISSGVWDDFWRKGRSDRALTVEEAWPYDPVKACKLNESKSERWCGDAYHTKPGSWRDDSMLVEEVQVANRTGGHRAVRVEKLQARPFNTEPLRKVLASGQSIYAGLELDMDAWGHASQGGAVIRDWEAKGSRHAVVLVGYRTVATGRQFLIHNSWGSDWRDGGYAWISEAMVRKHMIDAFTIDVESSTPALTPAPQPTPVPQPTPAPQPGPSAGDGCPAGQTRDQFLGFCVPRCADGSAPAALMCAASPAGASSPQSGTGCPAGQLPDWFNGQCTPRCPSGLPRAGGVCVL